MFSVTWCEWKEPVHFLFQIKFMKCGKEEPSQIKENAHTNSYKAILFDRMWSVWIVWSSAILSCLKLENLRSNLYVHIQTKWELDLTLELYLGSCQSLPFAFHECFRHCRYQNLDRLVWRKKLAFFENSTYVFWSIKVTN